MPGYHVHILVTAAGYDRWGRILPAGVEEDMVYAGSLLFQSDSSHRLWNYDVYHSHLHVEDATLSSTYVYLGKVREVYAPAPAPVDIVLPPTPPGFVFKGKNTLCISAPPVSKLQTAFTRGLNPLI